MPTFFVISNTAAACLVAPCHAHTTSVITLFTCIRFIATTLRLIRTRKNLQTYTDSKRNEAPLGNLVTCAVCQPAAASFIAADIPPDNNRLKAEVTGTLCAQRLALQFYGREHH
jgi:hypothetical protein